MEALQKHPAPFDIKELQGFLGIIKFFRRFLPATAKTLRPLTDALKGGGRGKDKISCSSEMQSAFEKAKQAVLDTACLAHPIYKAEISLEVDASACHVGAVLQQQRCPSDPWTPLGFFSRKLDSAQVKYSAF